MVTLPHHVEFLSEAWLAEAPKYLEREAEARKERLVGARSQKKRELLQA